MGAYATTSSLSLLLPNALSGGTTTSDTEAVATFSAHITRAESDINSVLAAKYSLPFVSTSIPPSVRTWTEDLACFYFLRAAVAQDGQMQSNILDRYMPAYDRLVKAQLEGFKESLADTAGSLVSRKTSTRYKSSTESEAPVFDLDNQKSWDVSQNRLDRIDTVRDL
jgi:hypothetical protein